MDNWIIKELPLRPGGIRPIIPQEEGRRRSKPPTRRRSQERDEVIQSQGLDVWQLGEELETKRKQLMKALNNAKKLTERLQLTEEMKLYLANITKASPDSEAKEEATEFLINLPNIERINQLKWLMSEAHQAEVEKQFQQRAIRNEIFD